MRFTLQNLFEVSVKSDFGAILKDNTLYFTSARNAARKNYGWNEEPFLDIYKAPGDSGTFLRRQQYQSLTLNS
jgi:hypothetical protein